MHDEGNVTSNIRIGNGYYIWSSTTSLSLSFVKNQDGDMGPSEYISCMCLHACMHAAKLSPCR